MTILLNFSVLHLLYLQENNAVEEEQGSADLTLQQAMGLIQSHFTKLHFALQRLCKKNKQTKEQKTKHY